MNIKKLSEIGINDLSLVGGKNSSLGEMFQNLTEHGIKIPDGFVITTQGYRNFIDYNNLRELINEELSNIDTDDLVSLRRGGLKIRILVQNGNFPEEIEKEIVDNYEKLSAQYTDASGNPQVNTDVAVRSSSTAEDLKEASFAGQQETYLNVRGKYQLLDSIKNCFASLYTDRAISYRKSIKYNGVLDISVCIQKMVRSDLASAGVAFSIDPDSGAEDVIVINGAWGLGELVVSGAIKPDEFIICKSLLDKGYHSIIDKKIGDKSTKMVYGTNPDSKVTKIRVGQKQRREFCMNEEQIITLAKYVSKIEKYYSNLYNKYTPMDIEWAIDGITNELYIVQARPETVHSNKTSNYIIQHKIEKPIGLKPIIQGISVGDSISFGSVKIINTLDNRNGDIGSINFNKGDILVTDITDPDWEPIMKLSSAIITNKGGRTSHCAVMAREFGIVAIVGTGNCTEILKDNQVITVSCAEGEIGYIYNDIIPYSTIKININDLPKINTKLLLNIGLPNDVFRYRLYPVNGVGLVRQEFMINNFIKIHPKALLDYDKLDEKLKDQISEIIMGYDNPIDYYIKKLAYGIAKIATTFYPKDVIVRFSDFKTNEYKNLLGGYNYEPDEENPMLGWRGASRYYSNDYRDAFGLECKAIKYLRDVIGLDNIIVMIPFCRTVKECILVQDIMAEYGLTRENGLKIYLMCEIPSNVILADKFCKYVDGFSIGSNDLTQLSLGIDRDSELVANVGDARDETVKEMIKMAIEKCKKNNVKIGICGQAPSDHPDFAEFLVEQGIDTISITPDSLFRTINAINNIEKKLGI